MITTEHESRTIQRLEEGMWQFARRGDESWFDRHVHADFVEVGRSGKRYQRAELFPVNLAKFDADIPLPNFFARRLGSNSVMTTYDSVVRHPSGIEAAHRVSVWVYENNRWQLLYHQGTAIDH